MNKRVITTIAGVAVGSAMLAVPVAWAGGSTGSSAATLPAARPSSSTTALAPGQKATALTISASAGRITFGHTVALGTRLTSNGTPVANQSVALLARPAGASTFTQVATATTSATGTATLTRRPAHNTFFQWRYAGTKQYAASTSPTKWVGVRTMVTIHAFATHLAKGQPLVVWGLTAPNKSGATITIYRHTNAGNTKLGTATVHSDGTWGFARTVHAGTASVFAHIPFVTGNAANNSVKISFTAA